MSAENLNPVLYDVKSVNMFVSKYIFFVLNDFIVFKTCMQPAFPVRNQVLLHNYYYYYYF